ncbi:MULTISPECIES: ABC transporter permease [unclassified Brevibacterium]|uniref:ABC transporter permease n=1 Tax=unclassified Brevibacterium TaxID=2614124 RepID=UPI001E47CBC8|nr:MULTISPECIES: ABC transporter permease [unclassified Brevibacterium]MCD1285678.1 ABC transporter permease [Brevibacterium sp. CCUG 69071]MDK8434736.1 ABC transporter permease [Brevibacterium sp. H-BE7]
MTTDISPAAPSPAPPPTAEAEPGKEQNLLQEILSGSWLVSVLAIIVALLLGGILIAVSNAEVVEAAKNLFAAPGSFFSTLFTTIGEAYSALFRGAVFDWDARTAERSIRPLTESMVNGTPLILAGLGIALAFRSGLFNIGGQGQVILGATIAGFLGYALPLPPVVHMLVAALGGIIGGAVWAGIAGVLKARTGANEVIVTIMLNSIAGYLLGYLLKQSWFTHTASANPQSRTVDDSAQMFLLLPAPFRLHFGFIIAILATIFVWWLLERSTVGFEFKAVGANPHAARTAGISVSKVTILVMVVAGALAGLGGAAQVLGTEYKLTGGISGSIGFDAITVALLGRSKPLGTFLAGLLFGAFKAGGYLMQSQTGTPIDIVLVVQSVIVLLIAAPPLVRSIFRLPTPVLKRKEA